MLTVIPAIWVAELAILNEKLKSGAKNCTLTAEQNYDKFGGLVCTL